VLNDNADVTGMARLRNETEKLPLLPSDFARLIDVVSGATSATDQQITDADESLWARMRCLCRERDLVWEEDELHA
jgi:hypothetical protein